ncbi:YjbQ family protein [Nanoarchaeota archaeon]|nr:MAG: YjbQ family protein [Nanoarchaeota archaeon]
MINTISFSTKRKFEVVDLTADVERIVKKRDVKEGLCVVHAPHATMAIILNENESGLLSDYVDVVKKLFSGDWLHDRIDNNAHAHLASAVIGSTRVLPIHNGELVRGTWQNILAIELDGPRQHRNIVVKIIKEK